MYYIHFAQTPKVKCMNETASSWRVTFSICITSDLRETIPSTPVTFKVSVLYEDLPRSLEATGGLRQRDLAEHTWQPKYVGDIHRLSLDFKFFVDQKRESGNITNAIFRVVASGPGRSLNDTQDMMYNPVKPPLEFKPLPPIVTVYSAPVDLVNTITYTESIQQRRFFSSRKGAEPLILYEWTGESLDRHTWQVSWRDGGIALAAWLDNQMSSKDDTSTPPADSPRLQVLELGCGIGTVGIHFAQLVPNCTVTLTDLAAASKIVKKNITCAKPASDDNNIDSNLDFQVFDWMEEDLPDSIGNHTTDLVIVSECFYNIDVAKHLVGKLQRIAELDTDRTAPILVSWKQRHEEENGFLKLMDEVFDKTYDTEIAMPAFEPELEERAVTKVFVYRHRERSMARHTLGLPLPSKVRHTPLSFLWEEGERERKDSTRD